MPGIVSGVTVVPGVVLIVPGLCVVPVSSDVPGVIPGPVIVIFAVVSVEAIAGSAGFVVGIGCPPLFFGVECFVMVTI